VEWRDQSRRRRELYFGDLIIIPISLIYRKYYGAKAAVQISLIIYGAMATAGYVIESLFTPFNRVPTNRHLSVVNPTISWITRHGSTSPSRSSQAF
jgi:hypothetical protein